MARFIPNAEIHRFGAIQTGMPARCSGRAKSFSLAYQERYAEMRNEDYYRMTFSRTSAIGEL
jgi:hypothetical protein